MEEDTLYTALCKVTGRETVDIVHPLVHVPATSSMSPLKSGQISFALVATWKMAKSCIWTLYNSLSYYVVTL